MRRLVVCADDRGAGGLRRMEREGILRKAAALDVTRCLAKFGGEVNVLDEGERKPLRIVAPHIKTLSVVAASLDAGADPRVKGLEGKIF